MTNQVYFQIKILDRFLYENHSDLIVYSRKILGGLKAAIGQFDFPKN